MISCHINSLLGKQQPNTHLQRPSKIAKVAPFGPDYKYRYLSLSPSRTASSGGPRVCHRVLRRSSLHRIPRVSRICPLQANHLRPRCRRAEATGLSHPPICLWPSRIQVQIRARLNRQGAYLAVLVHASTTTTLTGMSMSCHLIFQLAA